MIADNTEILKIVTELDNKYNASPPPNQQWAILYSKLAIIEFCGWIEQIFDEILTSYCSTKLVEQKYKDYHKKNIIDTNYGFHYEKNFQQMLIKTIGINNLENIEDCLENHLAYLSTFKSILGTFSKSRNIAAHTFTPTGTTITYDSPSIVISNINVITPILQKIEQEIMRY